MPTIDELLVRIDAQTEGLRRELARADTAVASTSRNIDRSLGRIDARFTALGGSLRAIVPAFSLGAVAGFSKKLLDAAGGLGETAEQLGITTEQLQIWQFAAAQGGVSAEALETGITKLSQKIGDAANGGKDAIEFFTNLGVKILDVAGKVRPTNDILLEVADRIAAIDEPAKRTALQMDAFGRGGAKLTTILSGGRAAFEGYGTEARKAGAILSDDLVKAADEASDQLVRLEKVALATGASIVANFAPFIVDAAKDLELFIRATKGEIDQLKELGAWFVRAGKAATGEFRANSTVEQLEAESAAMKELLKDKKAVAAERADPLLDEEVAEIASTVEALDLLIAKRKEAAQANVTINKPAGEGVSNPVPKGAGDKAARDIRDLENELRALQLRGREKAIQQALDKADDAVKAGLSGRVRELADAIYTEAKAIEIRNEALERATAGAEEERKNRQAASDDAQRIIADRARIARSIDQEIADNGLLIGALGRGSRAYEEQRILLDILNRYRDAGIPLVGAEIDKARELAGVLAEQQEQLKGNDAAARELGDAVSTAFEDAILQGKGLNEVLGGLLKTIAQIVLRASVTKPLENVFGGIFGGGGRSQGWIPGDLFGSSGTRINWNDGTSTTGGGSGILGFLSGLFRAGGGPVSANSPYIVGEQGPELFMPRVPGIIIPNHALGGMGDGTPSVQIHVDARGAQMGVAETVRRELAIQAPALIHAAVTQTQQRRLRNPNFFGREQGR